MSSIRHFILSNLRTQLKQLTDQEKLCVSNTHVLNENIKDVI